MEYETDLSLHGWPAAEGPDFTYGAKAVSSLFAATTYINYDDLPTDMPEWMETRDNLSWDQLSPFEEVILPENLNFGPDDLFKDLPPAEVVLQEIKQDVQNLKQEVYVDYTSPISSFTNEPEKIVICVRRVTIPTSTVREESSQKSYTDKINENNPQPSSLAVHKFIQSPSTLGKFNTVNGEELTLKEALNLNDADKVLNQLLALVEDNKSNSIHQAERQSDESSWDLEQYSCGLSFQDNVLENVMPGKFEKFLLLPSPGNDIVPSNSKVQSCETSLSSNETSPCLTNKPDSKIISYQDEETLSDVSSWDSEPCSPASSVELVTSFQDAFKNLKPGKLEVKTPLSPLQSNDATGSNLKQRGRKTSRVSSHRTEPYITNKRDRKREQNKQAATRYRHKKKKEEDLIATSLDEEEQRNKRLTEKYNGIKQELTYLKKIMREVFIAKGVISVDAFKKGSKS